MSHKIGVLSDIHGNDIALKVALQRLRNEGVDSLFVLGDLVGYYYKADVVIDLLSSWDCQVIAGNHERLLIDYVRGSQELRDELTAKYGSSFELISGDTRLIKYIEDLPETLTMTEKGKRVLLSHGSPWDRDLYLYPDNVFDHSDLVADVDADIILVGHTHYPMVCEIGSKMVINPGSVGQSRLSGGIANWGDLTFTDSNFAYEPRSDRFEVGQLVLQADEIDPELSYLSKVLKR